jgi:hypothetical protein
MSEEEPSRPAAEPLAGAPSASITQPPIPFHIGEEFSTASKKLPPTKIILAGLGLVLAIMLTVAYLHRPRSQATGAIENIAAVEIPGQNSVMAAITISIHNNGEEVYMIRTLKPSLETSSETFTDEPASVVDFERYFAAFPALKQGSADPLVTDVKIQPASALKGTIVVSFPVDLKTFNSRKALKLVVQPYDQPVPLTLTK